MRLYFEDTETDGSALVLIAGLATDALSWTFQVGPFSEAHRLITIDNRGVGRSPVPEGPYSIEEMAGDVLDLLDHLGLSRVSLLGHSMGGAIAQQIALQRPGLVDRLVLACTFSKAKGRTLPVLESWVDVLRLGGGPREIAHTILPWLYSKEFFSDPANFEAAATALEAHPYPLNPLGVAAQVEAIKNFDCSDLLSKLECETLILAAEQDLLIPPESTRYLASTIPKVSHKVLPGTGHACMLESPESFNTSVLEFLRFCSPTY